MGSAQKALGPFVHFTCDTLGRMHEYRIAVDGELEVTLVVERHRRDLAESIFAVKHPAIGS